MAFFASGMFFLAPAGAHAQGAEASNRNADSIADIIVTANKRQQSLRDVGLSITAATGEQLQQAGVTDVAKLTKAVSGFTVSTSYDGLPIFYIRGLGFAANQISAAPTVSTYVDEVPLPYTPMTGGVTLDLERVEVLKGPQGTLFGNNSTGGSINFIAAKPTSELSAGLTTSVDRFGQVFLEGFVSGPINDTLRVRFAANTTQGGDWQRSYTNIGPDVKNGSADKGVQRIIIDWAPSDRVKFELNANRYFDQSDPQALQFQSARPGGGPGSSYVDPVYGSIETYPLAPRSNRAADITADPVSPFFRSDRFHQISLRGDFKFTDEITFTSISNYSRLTQATNRDVDGTKIDIINGGHIGKLKTFAQELRLTGDFREIGLSTIIGANYSNDKIDERQPYHFPHFSILPPGLIIDNYGNFRSRTLAVFGNAEWKVTPEITLTGGVRYTRVRQSFDSCLPDRGDGSVAAFMGALSGIFRSLQGLGPSDAFVPGICVTLGPAPDYLPFRFLDKDSDRNVSWRAGVNYKPNADLLLYGLVSRGYKAGGYPFNAPLTYEQFTRVKQEEVTAYEAGLKYGRRGVSVSAAAFYYDYLNKQIFTNTLVPFLGPVSTLANVPKSKAYGFEAEGRVVPFEGLTLHGAVTYSHTEIRDPGTVTLDGFGNPIDLRGKPFGNAPRWSAIFDAEYRAPVGAGLEAFIGMNGLYNSKAYSRSEASSDFSIDPYTTYDARIGLASRDGWMATLWIRNLTNKYYWQDVNFIGEGYLRTTGQPRNFGATLSYRY
nr:TonB-dependent receptor [Sphingomonas sp. CDS-1]